MARIAETRWQKDAGDVVIKFAIPRWFYKVYGALARMPGGQGTMYGEMRHVLEQHAQKKMAIIPPEYVKD